MNNLLNLEVSFSRRRVLAAVGGIAGVGGAGYVGVRKTAKEGTINARFVVGNDLDDSGTVVGTTDILSVIGHTDSLPTRRIHPNYQQSFSDEPPLTVSASLHQRLQNDFDDVDYALSHSCPDAKCSTPQVSRQDFNSGRMGKEIRLFYYPHSQAAVIP